MVKSSNDPSKTYYQFLQEFIESEGMKDVTVEDLGKPFRTLTQNHPIHPLKYVYHELIGLSAGVLKIFISVKISGSGSDHAPFSFYAGIPSLLYSFKIDKKVISQPF